MIIFPGAELDFFPAGWMPGVGIILTGVPAAQGISQPVPDNPTGGFGPEAAPQGQDLLSACQSWSCSCHHFLGKPKEREGKLKQKQQKYPTQLRGQELLFSVWFCSSTTASSAADGNPRKVSGKSVAVLPPWAGAELPPELGLWATLVWGHLSASGERLMKGWPTQQSFSACYRASGAPETFLQHKNSCFCQDRKYKITFPVLSLLRFKLV